MLQKQLPDRDSCIKNMKLTLLLLLERLYLDGLPNPPPSPTPPLL